MKDAGVVLVCRSNSWTRCWVWRGRALSIMDKSSW